MVECAPIFLFLEKLNRKLGNIIIYIPSREEELWRGWCSWLKLSISMIDPGMIITRSTCKKYEEIIYFWKIKYLEERVITYWHRVLFAFCYNWCWRTEWPFCSSDYNHHFQAYNLQQNRWRGGRRKISDGEVVEEYLATCRKPRNLF